MARRYCKNTVPGKQGRGRKYPAAVRAEVVMAMIGSNSICAVARKYGVDFALKKDTSGDIPKYLVFFKARDADALTAAFKEYTAKEVRRASKDRPSVLEQLRALKAKVLSLTPDKARNKDKGLEL